MFRESFVDGKGNIGTEVLRQMKKKFDRSSGAGHDFPRAGGEWWVIGGRGRLGDILARDRSAGRVEM